MRGSYLIITTDRPRFAPPGNTYGYMSDRKRKRKSLKLKVEHLKLELEDRQEEVGRLESEFMKILTELEVEEIPQAPQKPLVAQQETVVVGGGDAPEGEENTEEVKPKDVVTEHPEEWKKLWKQVALLTHPDKTGGDPEKTEMYKRASEAWNRGDYGEVMNIAMDLGISPPDDSEAGIEVLEKSAVELEQKIKDTESSVLWMWANAPPNKKDKIIDLYLASRGKKRKK